MSTALGVSTLSLFSSKTVNIFTLLLLCFSDLVPEILNAMHPDSKNECRQHHDEIRDNRRKPGSQLIDKLSIFVKIVHIIYARNHFLF